MLIHRLYSDNDMIQYSFETNKKHKFYQTSKHYDYFNEIRIFNNFIKLQMKIKKQNFFVT